MQPNQKVMEKVIKKKLKKNWRFLQKPLNLYFGTKYMWRFALPDKYEYFGWWPVAVQPQFDIDNNQTIF